MLFVLATVNAALSELDLGHKAMGRGKGVHHEEMEEAQKEAVRIEVKAVVRDRQHEEEEERDAHHHANFGHEEGEGGRFKGHHKSEMEEGQKEAVRIEVKALVRDRQYQDEESKNKHRFKRLRKYSSLVAADSDDYDVEAGGCAAWCASEGVGAKFDPNCQGCPNLANPCAPWCASEGAAKRFDPNCSGCAATEFLEAAAAPEVEPVEALEDGACASWCPYEGVGAKYDPNCAGCPNQTCAPWCASEGAAKQFDPNCSGCATTELAVAAPTPKSLKAGGCAAWCASEGVGAKFDPNCQGCPNLANPCAPWCASEGAAKRFDPNCSGCAAY